MVSFPRKSGMFVFFGALLFVSCLYIERGMADTSVTTPVTTSLTEPISQWWMDNTREWSTRNSRHGFSAKPGKLIQVSMGNPAHLGGWTLNAYSSSGEAANEVRIGKIKSTVKTNSI